MTESIYPISAAEGECARYITTELRRDIPSHAIPLMGSSRGVFEFARDHLHHPNDRETFWAIHLDGKHRLIALNHVSTGTMTAALVHPREVFKPALLSGAAALIITHNHPSGDPTPSPEDVEITTRLCEIGRLVGIQVLDHVIIGEGTFTSCFEIGVVHG